MSQTTPPSCTATLVLLSGFIPNLSLILYHCRVVLLELKQAPRDNWIKLTLYCFMFLLSLFFFINLVSCYKWLQTLMFFGRMRLDKAATHNLAVLHKHILNRHNVSCLWVCAHALRLWDICKWQLKKNPKTNKRSNYPGRQCSRILKEAQLQWLIFQENSCKLNGWVYFKN